MTTTRRLRTLAATTAALFVAGTALAAVPAEAKGNGAVTKSGHCTSRSVYKLKAKPSNGRLETEFEVDSNRNGQVWTYTLRDNGVLVSSGRRTTVAPSGSFSVRRIHANRVGVDRIVAVAKNVRTGEVCRASIAI
jgi:hypothetical protein